MVVLSDGWNLLDTIAPASGERLHCPLGGRRIQRREMILGVMDGCLSCIEIDNTDGNRIKPCLLGDPSSFVSLDELKACRRLAGH